MVFLILLLCVCKKLQIFCALPVFILSSEVPSTAVSQWGGMTALPGCCLPICAGVQTCSAFFCSIVHLNIKVGLVLVQDFLKWEPGLKYQSAFRNTEASTGLKKASL